MAFNLFLIKIELLRTQLYFIHACIRGVPKVNQKYCRSPHFNKCNFSIRTGLILIFQITKLHN